MEPVLRAVLETFGADGRVVVDACRLEGVNPSPDQLHPDERPAIRQAVAKRRREFIAGRLLVRRAAERLGRAGVVLPMAADRAPRWPDGLGGSITHCGHWCAVALCRPEDGIAVGIDLEDHPRIDESLVPLFMSARERLLLDTHPHGERALIKTVVFSAKEAGFQGAVRRDADAGGLSGSRNRTRRVHRALQGHPPFGAHQPSHGRRGAPRPVLPYG
ncbi:4'-phosphopantetheinyl transferase superfamily protein [Azospirillum sp. TSO22-1]|uniref:4'-phosphopantetheinyl transferase family protein n=1 Tax=Azospirillum sp. TSO22-1 TaxID=716789 RepID=UPI0011B49F94|nr:4'-phosphopantetheinyl transferase superfamily protein [Azospirillum sp. TSO22-1]